MNEDPNVVAAQQAAMQHLMSQSEPQGGLQTQQLTQQPPPGPDLPQQNQQLGTQKKETNPHEKIIKSLLPATSNAYEPQVQALTKALLTKLIGYL
jgi:hypothetical protein